MMEMEEGKRGGAVIASDGVKAAQEESQDGRRFSTLRKI